MKATEGRAADVWHLVSVQGPAKVPFLSVLPRGPSLGYRLKLTLLPLTFPDDDAPEGGQLHSRIVGEKTANILWITYTHSSEMPCVLQQKWVLTIQLGNSSVARRPANFQDIEESSVYLGVS